MSNSEGKPDYAPDGLKPLDRLLWPDDLREAAHGLCSAAEVASVLRALAFKAGGDPKSDRAYIDQGFALWQSIGPLGAIIRPVLPELVDAAIAMGGGDLPQIENATGCCCAELTLSLVRHAVEMFCLPLGGGDGPAEWNVKIPARGLNSKLLDQSRRRVCRIVAYDPDELRRKIDIEFGVAAYLRLERTRHSRIQKTEGIGANSLSDQFSASSIRAKAFDRLQGLFEASASQNDSVKCRLIQFAAGEKVRMPRLPPSPSSDHVVRSTGPYRPIHYGNVEGTRAGPVTDLAILRRFELYGNAEGIRRFQSLAIDAGQCVSGPLDPSHEYLAADTTNTVSPKHRWIWTLFDLAWAKLHPALTANRWRWNWTEKGFNRLPYDVEQLRRSVASGTTSFPAGWAEELPDLFYSELQNVFTASVYAIDVLTNFPGREFVAYPSSREIARERSNAADVGSTEPSKATHSANSDVAKLPDSCFQDEDGTWLTARVLEDRFDIPDSRLKEWREQRCPDLDGERLGAKKVSGIGWVYFRQHVNQIANRRDDRKKVDNTLDIQERLNATVELKRGEQSSARRKNPR